MIPGLDLTFGGGALLPVALMTIAGSVPALMLFAIKPLIRDRLSKTAQYYMWLTALAVFALPFWAVRLPTGAAPTPIYSTIERYMSPETVEFVIETGIIQVDITSNHENAVIPDIKPAQSPLSTAFSVFAVLYAAGALLYLLFHLLAYWRFAVKMKRGRQNASDAEKSLLAKLCGDKRPPGLYYSDRAVTPMLLGLVRPYIVLPVGTYDGEQLMYILAHELTHLRRHDVWIKWLALLTGAVHGFNPVIYALRREIERACELACDEAVIHKLDSAGKQGYGDTLIAIAKNAVKPRMALYSTMSETKRQLKERLGAIMGYRPRSRITVFASIALVALVLCIGATLGFSGYSQANALTINNELTPPAPGTPIPDDTLDAIADYLARFGDMPLFDTVSQIDQDWVIRRLYYFPDAVLAKGREPNYFTSLSDIEKEAWVYLSPDIRLNKPIDPAKYNFDPLSWDEKLGGFDWLPTGGAASAYTYVVTGGRETNGVYRITGAELQIVWGDEYDHETGIILCDGQRVGTAIRESNSYAISYVYTVPLESLPSTIFVLRDGGKDRNGQPLFIFDKKFR